MINRASANRVSEGERGDLDFGTKHSVQPQGGAHERGPASHHIVHQHNAGGTFEAHSHVE